MNQDIARESYIKTPVKADQLDKVVKKAWGHEEWIVNNKLYCGKKLVFKKGFRCSLHYHKIKDETFYVASGFVLLEIGNDENTIENRYMYPGDVQRVLPTQLHRLTSLADAEVFEFSTQHFENNSYRIHLSGKVDLNDL